VLSFELCYVKMLTLQTTVIVQTVENGEWAFLMAMGTVIKKTLADRETILVDGNSILCFESSVTVDVRPVGGIAAICCGGEGIFNTELTGAYIFGVLFLSYFCSFTTICSNAYHTLLTKICS